MSPGPKRVLNRDPRRILVIKLFGLGNIIELMPVMALLRGRYPGARITVMTLESNAGVLEGFEPVDDIVYFRDKGWLSALFCAMRLVPAMWHRRFELVLDMDPIGRFCTLLSFATLAPRRVGFGTRGQYREQLYTEIVPLKEEQHIRRIFLDLLAPLGITVGHLPALIPPAVPKPVREGLARKLAALGPGGPLVVINPNASAVAFERRWPQAYFEGLITALLERDCRVILVGAPGELPHVEALAAAFAGASNLFNWAGQTTLTELSGLAARADLFISNDSGPLHLASAMGVPVIGLFGPESPARYGPVGPDQHVLYSQRPCSPCMSFSNEKKVRCPIQAACMTDLTPEAAADLALRILAGGARAEAAALT